jgi:transposase
MTKIAKQTKQSDLTDEEWERIAPLTPTRRRGRAREVEFHEVNKHGALSCAFGVRLADAVDPFRPLRTVYGWFQELARRFLFQTIYDDAARKIVGHKRYIAVDWMIRSCRFVRDYERLIDVSTAIIHLAMGGLPLRRKAHP